MKPTKSSKIIIVVGLIILILVNISLLLVNYKTITTLKMSKASEIVQQKPEQIHLNLSNEPLSIENFTKVTAGINESAIILSSTCNKMTLASNEYQIYSIRQGLENTIDIRPTIHDLMRGILSNYKIDLILVKITDVKDELYFANVYFQNKDNILSIDAKPSDAIALAIRTKTPIYISNEMLKKYAEYTC